ncbi:MAG TPA: 50S ribosomal protein L30 [Bacillota bacterium]|jgi:large subunit ribosomal protein L30|nr:50S ribosomal protein L30 [Bacillota bacterium]HOB86586.1 50S ribosomal protein L30 [Bacillota bacterium]HOP68305.1 50S ribosomal protein L30 [Bacillota bacterium]HPT33972.1 50S ribosomal protein L30 [Bacillota bacterium]HPZ65015.1 50S ribosomal protein L30 [Bacillota bacterium]
MASKKGKLLITLVRSPVGCRPEHRGTVRALGLKKVGQTVEHRDEPAIRGMVQSINFLVKVEKSS